MIDDDIGDRLDAGAEQSDERGFMSGKIAVAVAEVEIFFGIVTGAVLAGERGRRQPDEVEAAGPDRGGLFFDNLIPSLCSVAWEFLRMSMAVGLPVEALEHHPIVLEARLRAGRPRQRAKRDK